MSSPQIIGPYRILSIIGQGGMGCVYRGFDPDSGEHVALKTVRIANAALLSSFRREIHSLSRVQHPGVVRVVADGVHDGMPWFAMEYLEGETLRNLFKDLRSDATTVEIGDPETVVSTTVSHDELAGPVPAPSRGRPLKKYDPVAVRPALTVMRRLCDALAYLHGEGLVHRDLKPDNVVVLPGELPVIVDFGLALQLGGAVSRDSLAERVDGGGTVSYMSPEQVRGSLLDARSDLYAVGCMLFELVAGRPPYTGTSAARIALAHVEQPLPRLSSYVYDVPLELEQLIERLLEKEPHRRLGYADEVARVLGVLGAGEGVDAPAPRPYLYRPGFAGRAELRQEITRRCAQVFVGGCRMQLLSGESGVGKTRLALEVARDVESLGIRVLTGECIAPPTLRGSRQSGPPLAALRRTLQVVGDCCRESGPQEVERLIGSRGPVLAQYEPSLRLLPGQEAFGPPDELPLAAARHRLFSFLTETLAAFTSDHPSVLILDDLQWADELTTGFLEHLARREGGSVPRLFVLGLYREEEACTGVERLVEAGVQRLELDRLSDDEVASIVADMLATSPPPAQLVAFLARESEGNPFFVAEYIRAAVEGGQLRRENSGAWRLAAAGSGQLGDFASLGLPRSLRELLQRRVLGLDDDALSLMSVASVLGRDFSVALLETVSGFDEMRVLDALGELSRRHVVDDDVPGRIRFAHDKLRETAYEALDQDQRCRYHRAAAVALEGLRTGDPDRSAATLARHWDACGESQLAAHYALDAARAAKASYALAEAERWYRVALKPGALGPEPWVSAALELASDILRIQGRAEEALRLIAEAGELALERHDENARATCLLAQATVDREVGHIDVALDAARAALDLARRAGNRKVEGEILANLGIFCAESGKRSEAYEAYEMALAIHREIDDRNFQGKTLSNLAALVYEDGRLDEARKMYEEARAIHRETGNRRSEGFTLNNLALLEEVAGDWRAGWRLAEEALAITRQVGDRRFEGIVLGNLADCLVEGGLLEEARAAAETALEIHKEVGNVRYQGGVLISLAALERRTGQYRKAREALGVAIDRLRKVNDQFYVIMALVERAMVALAEREDPLPFVEQARGLAAAIGVPADSPAMLLLRRLDAALQDRDQGKALVHGESSAHVPEWLRLRHAEEDAGERMD